ncbi:hypothetical protein V8C86DRAFT_2634413 [Haematococcus lacustris]
MAADVAVDQFEVLLQQFGGPAEHRRWSELRPRLEVLGVRGRQEELVSARVRSLGHLAQVGQQQTAVFGLGDALHATTLTANGAAVRSMERQGIALEVVLHRAVWLTGT